MNAFTTDEGNSCYEAMSDSQRDLLLKAYLAVIGISEAELQEEAKQLRSAPPPGPPPVQPRPSASATPLSLQTASSGWIAEWAEHDPTGWGTYVGTPNSYFQDSTWCDGDPGDVDYGFPTNMGTAVSNLSHLRTRGMEIRVTLMLAGYGGLNTWIDYPSSTVYPCVGDNGVIVGGGVGNIQNNLRMLYNG